MKKQIKIQNLRMENVFPQGRVRTTDVLFTEAILLKGQRQRAYVVCRKDSTSVTFFRPFLSNFNAQAFTVHFPQFKSGRLPNLVVAPDQISTPSSMSLADILVAQRGKIHVRRAGKRVEFKLTFDDREYRTVLGLGVQITPTHKLGDFVILI